MAAMGSPGPLGLLGFGATTYCVTFVDMGWVSPAGKELYFTYFLLFGGFAQFVAGVLELFKGNSFGFAAFCTYGSYWMGQGLFYREQHNTQLDFQGEEFFADATSAFYATWALISFGFWICAWNKNVALIIVLFFVFMAFVLFSAAAAKGEGHEDILKAGGVSGFLAGTGALYMAFAELINEDVGAHVLPGLRPIRDTSHKRIDKDLLQKRITYSRWSNKLSLNFRDLKITSDEDIAMIKKAIEERISDGEPPGGKCHVVANYRGTQIADAMVQDYWSMAQVRSDRWCIEDKQLMFTVGLPCRSSQISTTYQLSASMSFLAWAQYR